ncbi:MAG: hypothetical protein LBK77_06065 [Spirochaetaceae bacterium]|jgi:hypothetical protein|nr:hypothetical protein [Spirochaetaceae bacterium]
MVLFLEKKPAIPFLALYLILAVAGSFTISRGEFFYAAHDPDVAEKFFAPGDYPADCLPGNALVIRRNSGSAGSVLRALSPRIIMQAGVELTEAAIVRSPFHTNVKTAYFTIKDSILLKLRI